MKLARKEVLRLHEAISAIKGKSGNARWTYALAKNIRTLSGEVESTKEAFSPKIGYQQYERERIQLCNRMAAKDDNDKPLLDNGNFVIVDMAAFYEELAKLREKYAEALEEQEKLDKEFDKFIEEDVEIKLHMVDPSEIPDGLEPEELEGVLGIIND